MNALSEFTRGRAKLFASFLLLFLFAALSPPSPRASAATFVEQKLIPDDATTDDAFGYGSAVEGDIAMFGEAHADINGNQEQGEVYVYARSVHEWV